MPKPTRKQKIKNAVASAVKGTGHALASTIAKGATSANRAIFRAAEANAKLGKKLAKKNRKNPKFN